MWVKTVCKYSFDIPETFGFISKAFIGGDIKKVYTI